MPPGARATEPRRRPAGKVPFEYLGLARVFRERIRKAQAAEEAEIAAILAPLRPRAAWSTPDNPRWLRQFAAAYLARDHVCRLGSAFDVAKRRLRLVDMRLTASTMRFERWADTEPALGIVLRTVATAPFSETVELVADIGLHALARRLERSAPAQRTDAAVLEDIRAIGGCWRAVIEADDPEFRVVTPSGGAWIGRVTTVSGMPALAVRTFVDG